MEINLCKNYKMTISTLNYVLERRIPAYESKEGKTISERWVVEGYFSNIKSLLKGYFNKRTLNCNSKSIERLIKKIDEVERVIENFKVEV